jgi:hypothetical protein
MTESSYQGPNRYSREEWDWLSLKEQIRWNDEFVKRQARSPLKIAEGYYKGIYTLREVGTAVFLRLATFNVDEFLDQFPVELLTEVQRHADGLPSDEDDKAWADGTWIGGALYDPRFSIEENREFTMERDRSYRLGVRIYRDAAARRKKEAAKQPPV